VAATAAAGAATAVAGAAVAAEVDDNG
jgi:hypothetical protein